MNHAVRWLAPDLLAVPEPPPEEQFELTEPDPEHEPEPLLQLPTLEEIQAIQDSAAQLRPAMASLAAQAGTHRGTYCLTHAGTSCGRYQWYAAVVAHPFTSLASSNYDARNPFRHIVLTQYFVNDVLAGYCAQRGLFRRLPYTYIATNPRQRSVP